ncbi:NAD(P)H-hydrate dehydratase [Nesterenkonia alkaliphila]|uniref:NAD(P)H-hydrate dehydratase n=1 Tax=Nesterenkonia alkaliphila TaxID=1463631 RepID=UPI001662C970|nr:NAD(P)H-hydrate dehydratase [Nesterenkonia alkaliphila]GFZ77656.1 bifunctional NAD(P)H-hydrate repair enzyme [Nesterenkonia alkaliphila]
MTAQQLEQIPVYTGEQIRAAEKPLLDSGQGRLLMRRAAYGLAKTIADLLGQKRPQGAYGACVTGLIGPGNNGGDGLYALAFLARRGAEACAVLIRDRAHPEALEAFRAAGGRVLRAVPEQTQVLIDAILGTGYRSEFTRPEVPGLTQALRAVDDAGSWSPTVVACDLPSGVNADTGAAGHGVIPANHTVTFGGVKQGLIAGRGGLLSGRVHTVDIGIGAHLSKTPTWLLAPSTAAPVPLRPPEPAGHKYSRGVVHLVVGSAQYPGAAQLTAGAAVGTGVGMVTLQAPAALRSQVLSAYPEVVGTEDAAAAVSRAGGVVLGPGLGNDPARLTEAEAVLEKCLEAGTACVLDASGLGLIRDQLRRRGGLGNNVLITPHLGEARQIAKDLRDSVLTGQLAEGPAKADPVEAARRIAGRLDCTVLLKGPTTVIASPEGEVLLHRAGGLQAAGAPGLATAGTGDVLSGILGALAATQGGDWLQVAALGVSLHTAAAHRIDPHGQGRFGASDLLAGLP